jgi:predicted SAM-dependent methyltransferase
MIKKIYKKLSINKQRNVVEKGERYTTNKIATKSDLINLGCGSTYHSDWDNFDLVPALGSIRRLDLLKKLPFLDASYGFCYSSHVLEHMPRSYSPKFLRETYRVLRPSGVIRIVVPDLEGIVRRYLAELEAAASGDESAFPRYQWMTLELLDQLTRSFSGGFMGRLWFSRPLPVRGLIEERLGSEAGAWIRKFDGVFSGGDQAPLLPEQVFEVQQPLPKQELKFREQGEIHRWMYDRISLAGLLREAGFREIRVCAATESSIPKFSSYHLDTDESGAIRKPDSLFMEGIK